MDIGLWLIDVHGGDFCHEIYLSWNIHNMWTKWDARAPINITKYNEM